MGFYRTEWFFPHEKVVKALKDDSQHDQRPEKIVKQDFYEDFLSAEYMNYEIEGKGKPALTKGDTCDIKTLLFTDSRHSLIRCQTGETVSFGALQDKFVLIAGFLIPLLKNDTIAELCRNIIETCRQLCDQRGDFEAVIVVRLRPDLLPSVLSSVDAKTRAVTDFLSAFPPQWLSVPPHFVDCYNNVWEALGLENYFDPRVVLVDKQGKVLQQDHYFLSLYGVDSYPFTDKKIDEIKKRDKVVSEEHTLESLVDCSSLSRAKGSLSVSLSYFDSLDIPVGLYLCSGGYYMKELYQVYQECKAKGLKFEVVLVYHVFRQIGDWEMLQKRIKDKLQQLNICDWLVLPFCDSVNRRIYRICSCIGGGPSESLVVVGPKGTYWDHYALEFLQDYGVSAYPFCRRLHCQNVLDKLRSVTLSSLFEGKEFVSTGTQEKVSVSSLQGRKIIVCFDHIYPPELTAKLAYWPKMLDCYAELKQQKDIEVVFVCWGESSQGASFDEQCEQMPWLVLPYDQVHSDYMAQQVHIMRDGEDLRLPMFVSFGSDGHIVTLNAFPMSLSDKKAKLSWFEEFDVFSGCYLDRDVRQWLEFQSSYMFANHDDIP